LNLGDGVVWKQVLQELNENLGVNNLFESRNLEKLKVELEGLNKFEDLKQLDRFYELLILTLKKLFTRKKVLKKLNQTQRTALEKLAMRPKSFDKLIVNTVKILKAEAKDKKM